MALCLYNYLEMWETPAGLEIVVEGEGTGQIVANDTNIVYQVACQVFNQSGYHPQGIGIKLTNQIPVARGLGSSAAALVGGILAANELAGRRLSLDQLLELAVGLEGHPDNVAPALLGGIVVCAQVGSGLCYRRIAPPQGLQVIVAIPKFELSTQAARNVLPRQVPLVDAVFNISRACLLVMAFLNQDFALISQVMDDRLHQPYRTALVPGLDQVFQAAREAGALGVALSGAGPTVVALAREHLADVEAAMRKTLADHGIDCTIKRLLPSTLGAEIL